MLCHANCFRSFDSSAGGRLLLLAVIAILTTADTALADELHGLGWNPGRIRQGRSAALDARRSSASAPGQTDWIVYEEAVPSPSIDRKRARRRPSRQAVSTARRCSYDPAVDSEPVISDCGPSCGTATCGTVACDEPACSCESCCDPCNVGTDYCGSELMCASDCGGNWWVRTELLLWWIEKFDAPPLLTTSDAGTAYADSGVLGRSTTTILVDGDDLAGKVRAGGRLSLGWWRDPCQTIGFEAIYTALSEDSATYSIQSQGTPILARPFFNVEAGVEAQDAEVLAYDNMLEGSAVITRSSRFQGVELLLRGAASREYDYRIDWVAGWRFNRLDDELAIMDTLEVTGAGTGMAVGTTMEQFDRFETRNSFHGVELGVVAAERYCQWSLELMMKLGLGNTRSRAELTGGTITSVPIPGGGTDVSTADGALLVQDTNSGVHKTNQFSVVPELGLTLGYDLTPRLRFTLAYSFIYWSQVVRPGDLIDMDVNLTQLDVGGLVGSPRPEFRWVKDDVWVQGLNLGLDYRF